MKPKTGHCGEGSDLSTRRASLRSFTPGFWCWQQLVNYSLATPCLYRQGVDPFKSILISLNRSSKKSIRSIAIDPFKSIFHLGKNCNRSNWFFCVLRCIAIFFSQIKIDTGKRLKRTVKIYSLHSFPFRDSRKFKIDRVESYTALQTHFLAQVGTSGTGTSSIVV